MNIKSFIFGLGCGLMLLSVFFYFLYSYQIKGGTAEENIKITDAEIVERAKKLGMIPMTESLTLGSQNKLGDDDIIDMASQLGMVFPENDEASVNYQNEDMALEGDNPEEEPILEEESMAETGEMAEPLVTKADSDVAEVEQPEPVAKPKEVEQPEPTARPKEAVAEPVVEPKETAPPDEVPVVTANEDTSDIPEVVIEEGENAAEESESDDPFIMVDIPRGFSANQIAQKLYDLGIVNDKDGFLRFLIDSNATKRISFGRYYFYKGESFESILGKLNL